MEIVDGHTNLLYPNERLPGSSRSLWTTFRERLEVLREAGVSRAIACRNESVEGRSYDELLGWNQRIADACEASDGMFIPSAIIRPALGEQACELLRHCREQLGMNSSARCSTAPSDMSGERQGTARCWSVQSGFAWFP